MTRRLRGWGAPVATVVAAVAIWQAWVQIGGVRDWILPAPSAVAAAGWQSRSALLQHATTTSIEAVVGLVLGTVAGLGLALVISLIPSVRRAVWPVVVTSQTVPIIVLAPLVAIWFGYGLTPKIVLVALICFFPVAVAAVAGLAGADPEHVELVESFGASRWDVLRHVRGPAAMASVIAGIRIAAAYAVGNAVIGEYVGGTSGLGIFIDQSHRSYRTDRMLAGVAVIAVVSIVLFSLVGWIGRRLMPWRRDRPTDHTMIGIDL
ncbi:MAG TPA: ABC transporter permease [Acidimicrobiales bacterium]|nr:ABC transporter permease [Acidimicrobiales bacterium]